MYREMAGCSGRKERPMTDHQHEEAQHHEHAVEVSVSTTAGFFPTEGFNQVPINQAVHVELDKAKHALHIKDTTNWIASVASPAGKRVIDPSKTYAENGLSGKVEIDWGPSEGGGG
jgi:hypothetical protein